DIDYRNEVFYLLKNSYPKLDEQEKKSFLELLERIVRDEEKKFSPISETEKNPKSKDEIEFPFPENSVYNEKIWTNLSAIEEYLEGEWKTTFNRLQDLYKQRDFPPQYASYHWSFVGPISPVDKTDIANMDLDDLIGYLEKYEPDNSVRGGHSREGLSRQLDQDVENNPTRYLDHYNKLLESKLHFQFHNGILYGLRKAISNKNLTTFSPLVEYIYGLHNKYEGYGTSENSSRNGFRNCILGIYRCLYEKFDRFEKSERNINFIRNIFPYLEDPSPDAKYDKANDDPIFTGINSVRGETLHALFKCILWMSIEKDQWKEDCFSLPIIDESLAQVKQHFNHSDYKDFDTDRSVMGEYLRFIYRIRKNWFEENLNWILPSDNKKVGLVTFFTYIQRGGFSESLYKCIKPWYEYVLKDLSNLELETNFDKGLKPYAIAEHIMMIYAYELEPIEPGGLVELFFENATSFMKGNAIRFIGTKIPKEEDYIRLARALWEWRAANGSLSSQELDGFLEWWGEDKFENDWIFQYLYLYKNSEEISVSEFQIFKLFEILDENFTKDPKLVIEIIDSYSQSNRYHLHPRKDQSLWSILKKGLAVDDLTVRGMTEDIVHRLGSFGYLEYRELLGL
ncbi:MAG: hypothetical protein JJT78_05860, partial [Leptospira sp.]|nr:hypothetical protein [Leptospira sp.]